MFTAIKSDCAITSLCQVGRLSIYISATRAERLNHISQYFNAISEHIAASYKLASISSHKPDIGANRELVVREFLQKHIPKRLTASLGGQVIGLDGSESRQIDILVSSDISIRFEQNDKTFVTAESLASAISVKSRLDKPSLEDCLQNLASIPQIDGKVLSFLNLDVNAFARFTLMHPSLYVFAYEGMAVNTCLEHVTEYYATHPDIPKNRYASGIIVNGKYLVRYCKAPASMANGQPIPGNTFVGQPFYPTDAGYPFTFYLNDLTAYVTWLPYMNVNLTHYFTGSYGQTNPEGSILLLN